MTEPRSSPSNPDPVEVERRRQEDDVASPEAVSTLTGANGARTRERPADPYAERVPPDPVRDDEIVEPAAVQPGGISLATIVTVAIIGLLILALLFWIF